MMPYDDIKLFFKQIQSKRPKLENLLLDGLAKEKNSAAELEI